MQLPPPTIETLLALDLGNILDGRQSNCMGFDRKLRDAAKVALASKFEDKSMALSLLAELCSFHFRADDRSEPFGPMMVTSNSRSMQGSDLNHAHIAVLEEFAAVCGIRTLQTRIYDLVWCFDRSRHGCARLAIDGYTALADGLSTGTFSDGFDTESRTPFGARDLLVRATNIARATGWRKLENDGLRSVAERYFRTAIDDGSVMPVIHFGGLAVSRGIVSASDALGLTEPLLHTLRSLKSLQSAADLQTLRRAWAHKCESDQFLSESLTLADIYDEMADASTGYFMGSHFLEQSLATLQNLKGVRDRRNATHAKLRTAQINTVEEMGEISHSSDITGLVNHYLQQIDGKNILDILMTMAMYAAPATRERIEASASKSVNDHPLSAMFASRSLDRRGRTVSIEPGATLNDALESGLTRTIIQAQDINLSLVVAAALDPAREALMEKGPVKFELILALCINSPFVPVDLQHIFAKGLHAFFQGDDAIAIAILAPLLEGGLRNLLEYAGELITTVDENGIEQAVTLSHILSQKRSTLDRIIGCRYSFAIEMLFDHTSGPKVRHRICHAIYFDADFYSKDSSYGCFLIFSLVMVTMGGHWRELKSHLESVLPHEWLRPIYVDLFAPRDNDAEARGSLDEVDVAAGGKAAESAQG